MRRRRATSGIVSVLLLVVLVAGARAAAVPRILILSAFPAEGAKLLAATEEVTDGGIYNGRRFFFGRLAGKDVILGLTGIGMVNAERTSREVLDDPALSVSAILFSGVAGSPANIGDVVVPDRWRAPDGTEFPVDPDLLNVAWRIGASGSLDSCVAVPDTACTGLRSGLLASAICVESPRLLVGGRGRSGDPFGGRAVPCLSHAGDLLGCEACGAPPAAPDPARFLTDAVPFVDPFFYVELLGSFAPIEGDDAAAVDMETAAVARLASERKIPFLAFRAVSDGGGDPLALPGYPFQFFVYQQLAADNAAAATLRFLEEWSGPSVP